MNGDKSKWQGFLFLFVVLAVGWSMKVVRQQVLNAEAKAVPRDSIRSATVPAKLKQDQAQREVYPLQELMIKRGSLTLEKGAGIRTPKNTNADQLVYH